MAAQSCRSVLAFMSHPFDMPAKILPIGMGPAKADQLEHSWVCPTWT